MKMKINSRPSWWRAGCNSSNPIMNLNLKYPEPKLPIQYNPGDYYRNKDLAADYWHDILIQAKEEKVDLKEIKYIESRLEAARYVGD